MPIRRYLLIIISACTLGGFTLSMVSHHWFKRIEEMQHEVGTSSLTLTEISYLGGSLSRLLTTADLVFGSNETHLAEDGLEQLDEIVGVLDALRTRPLVANFSPVIDAANRELTTLDGQLERFSRSVDQEDIDAATVLAKFDQSSASLIDLFEKLDTNSKAEAERSRKKLDDERLLFRKGVIWGGIIYLLGSLLLARWAWKRIVTPLQELTVSAHRSMNESLPFVHGDLGPGEVRELSSTIGQFIHSLEDKVERRTLELQDNAARLESEIHERIAIEEELKLAKIGAEQASEAKGDFLANMSHEMRTPLNAILGFSNFLIDTPLKEEQRNYANIVLSSGNALLTLINDILDFSKIEAGKLDLEYREFYLRDCIESAIDLVASTAIENGLDLSYEIDPGIPACIISDEARLRQVLLNLIGNAVKFTESGSVAICVTASQPFVSGGGQLKIHVRDTGIGIEADKQQLLFQNFEQLHSSTNRKFGGTGLGLTITKSLVELMGGEVSVSSVLGVGSTFSFTLPAEIGAMEPRPFERMNLPEFEGKHLLIVDGCEASSKRMAGLVTSWGFHTSSVSGLSEALRLISQGKHYDIILTSCENASVLQNRMAARHRRYPRGTAKTDRYPPTPSSSTKEPPILCLDQHTTAQAFRAPRPVSRSRQRQAGDGSERLRCRRHQSLKCRKIAVTSAGRRGHRGKPETNPPHAREDRLRGRLRDQRHRGRGTGRGQSL